MYQGKSRKWTHPSLFLVGRNGRPLYRRSDLGGLFSYWEGAGAGLRLGGRRRFFEGIEYQYGLTAGTHADRGPEQVVIGEAQ